jgi:prolipoprotein diacylglyceryltransferase
VVAPALLLAYGIGRIGCQMSGDGCWGMVNLNPKPEWLGFLPGWMWAFDYPNNVINAGILIPGCEGSHCHVLGQPVYPTPFYETVMALLLFAVLWMIRKRVRIHGYLFSIYLILNGMERVTIEQLRVNIQYDFLGMKITQAEIIAVGLIAAGFAGLFFFHTKNAIMKYKNAN